MFKVQSIQSAIKNFIIAVFKNHTCFLKEESVEIKGECFDIDDEEDIIISDDNLDDEDDDEVEEPNVEEILP